MTAERAVEECETRREALVCAAALRTARGDGHVLAAHPLSDSLPALPGSREATDLAKLLWDELEATYMELPRAARARDILQKLPAGHDALVWLFKTARRTLPRALSSTYWIRRRFITQGRTWRQQAEMLPAYWRRLVESHRGAFDEICRSVGTEMIGHAALLESRGRVARWLGPLGTRGARAVADRLVDLVRQPAPRDLAHRWRVEFPRAAKINRGVRIAGWLGAALLSAAFRRLEGTERTCVETMCDEAVREELERERRADVYPDQHGERIESMLGEVIVSRAAMALEEQEQEQELA